MKKLLLLVVLFTSCGTAPSEDVQNLQKNYETVYRIDNYRYITSDSTGVYDIRVTFGGTFYSKVKIK